MWKEYLQSEKAMGRQNQRACDSEGHLISKTQPPII